MRVAVIGHVEWIEFVRVAHMPAAGDIVHAREAWQEPGGGGAVAAVQLARLAGDCTFFTTLGDDDLGGDLQGRQGPVDDPAAAALAQLDDVASRQPLGAGEEGLGLPAGRLRPGAIVVVQGLEFSFLDDRAHAALARTLRTVRVSPSQMAPPLPLTSRASAQSSISRSRTACRPPAAWRVVCTSVSTISSDSKDTPFTRAGPTMVSRSSRAESVGSR